jgi:predicted nucleotidyltransferase
VSNKDIATKNEILRGLVGSTAHGINIVGQDDRDETGIFIETPANVCGLMPCDHYIWRTQPDGVRSGPGDLDLTMYSLRKFCKLAEQGNPSVMVLLWLPKYIVLTDAGQELIRVRDAFISRNAGERFLGYLVSQKMKMKGEKAHTVNRPELIEKYGYDTKFAMHALRLGFEGVELLTRRSLTLPVAEPNLSTLRAVRTGQFKFLEILQLIDETEIKLRSLLQDCNWKSDRVRIDDLMVKMHLEYWAQNQEFIPEHILH